MIELIPVAVLQNRMTHASRKGMTYLRCKSDSLTLGPAEAWTFADARVSSISFNSVAALSGVRDRSSAARAASGRPWRNSQRGDSDTMKLPSTNRIPGGSETQKIRRHAWSLKAKPVAALVDAVTSATR